MAAERTQTRGRRRVIEATLAAAGIPRERCGKDRTARLQGQELSLYEQVLGAFASTGCPTASWVCERATALGLDPDDAFALLAREDLVHLGTARQCWGRQSRCARAIP